ncbi:hypothetical protein CP532_0156 [Ophiocordyceps camponoti-leonardi (nom. inval.)]|nr:hypothetical protein CP532_0156 [Ophiocordyceps camponoti-leonardi (nom. inval.)]
MGTDKKETNRRARQNKATENFGNVRVKGENFYRYAPRKPDDNQRSVKLTLVTDGRDAKKVKTLSMYKEGKTQRNSQGRITKAASYQSRDVPEARIEPNRRWFTNTRTVSQHTLQAFRAALSGRTHNPYEVLLKSNKLPLHLFDDQRSDSTVVHQHQAPSSAGASSFTHTFGPKSQRKRVNLGVGSLEDLADSTLVLADSAPEAVFAENISGERLILHECNPSPTSAEPVFDKGQSKRIWNELYKVVDSSDVVLQVLDARDPLGTRCRTIEKYLRYEAPHKHLILILNKCDLIPTGIAAGWVRYLSKEYPTLAFHASITNSFGKGSLITLLRQFCSLHSNRKQISVGVIGGPNTGKSSIINTLLKKKVCSVAPIPGETKVWQYVSLTRRIYLIDSPGVVPPSNSDSPTDLLLRGVVRVEKVQDPEQYIAAVLGRVKRQHVQKTYGLSHWENETGFLEALAQKCGRLLRGGEPDISGVAKMVLNDFVRGKIPWFTPMPSVEAGSNTGS